jgi:hypothetical protein
MADASVRYLTNDVNSQVYADMGSVTGGEVIPAL